MIVAQEREQQQRPVTRERLARMAVNESAALPPEELECFAGGSSYVSELRRFVEEQAKHQQAALLIGERGLRQEQIARAIHNLGERRRLPFLAINAQTLSPDELDHLLNGPNGVLTSRTIGVVYLNELVNLVPLLQQRLAIYLEEQRWRASERASAGPRLILSTEWKPGAMTAENRIAYGLVEMLRPHSFILRPLRERREDIPQIVELLVRRLARRHDRTVKEVMPGAMKLLAQYCWERNFDELEAVLESVIAHLPPHEIGIDQLPEVVRNVTLRMIPQCGIELDQTVDDFERRLIEVALGQTGGNQTRAAVLLGLRVQTLNAKIKRLAIPVKC